MFRPIFMLLVAVFAHNHALAVDIEEAWMRAMPPGQPTAAAYLTLSNPDRDAVTLVEARSEMVGRIELHRSIQEDGMWRMRRVPDLLVPAGGEVKMAPGGIHLMLFELERSLREGETMPLTLEFDTGETRQVDVSVRSLDAGAGHHHHH